MKTSASIVLIALVAMATTMFYGSMAANEVLQPRDITGLACSKLDPCRNRNYADALRDFGMCEQAISNTTTGNNATNTLCNVVKSSCTYFGKTGKEIPLCMKLIKLDMFE